MPSYCGRTNLFLLVTILAQTLLTLVRGNLMTFSFLPLGIFLCLNYWTVFVFLLPNRGKPLHWQNLPLRQRLRSFRTTIEDFGVAKILIFRIFSALSATVATFLTDLSECSVFRCCCCRLPMPIWACPRIASGRSNTRFGKRWVRWVDRSFWDFSLGLHRCVFTQLEEVGGSGWVFYRHGSWKNQVSRHFVLAFFVGFGIVLLGQIGL